LILLQSVISTLGDGGGCTFHHHVFTCQHSKDTRPYLSSDEHQVESRDLVSYYDGRIIEKENTALNNPSSGNTCGVDDTGTCGINDGSNAGIKGQELRQKQDNIP